MGLGYAKRTEQIQRVLRVTGPIEARPGQRVIDRMVDAHRELYPEYPLQRKGMQELVVRLAEEGTVTIECSGTERMRITHIALPEPKAVEVVPELPSSDPGREQLNRIETKLDRLIELWEA